MQTPEASSQHAFRNNKPASVPRRVPGVTHKTCPIPNPYSLQRAGDWRVMYTSHEVEIRIWGGGEWGGMGLRDTHTPRRFDVLLFA